MCLLLLAVQEPPEFKLVLAANRDEYYDRPTAPAAFWDGAPHLLAGKDLRAGGTWLGITKTGRIAAITNYRDPTAEISGAPSRGKLVSGFLLGQQSPERFLEGLAPEKGRYNGFNLIIGEGDQLFWFSNRGDGAHKLSPGIYGLSNRLLDTPWPKLIRSKEAMAHLISNQKNPSLDALFQMLMDRTVADDDQLPDTGVGIVWERILSPIFITSPTYGTRCSTIILIDRQDRVTFTEKTFNSDPQHPTSVEYQFQIQS
ncbi:MAG: NRDE family protein [Desulfobacteraceae bacterium]|jgi:uncharacterized protein with NRDE domain